MPRGKHSPETMDLFKRTTPQEGASEHALEDGFSPLPPPVVSDTEHGQTFTGLAKNEDPGEQYKRPSSKRSPKLRRKR